MEQTSPSPNSICRSVDFMDVLGLYGWDTLVNILQNVILRNRQKVVDSGDVVDRVCQNTHLVDPSVAEDVNILLSHLAFGPGGQYASGIDYLKDYVINFFKKSLQKNIEICKVVVNMQEPVFKYIIDIFILFLIKTK